MKKLTSFDKTGSKRDDLVILAKGNVRDGVTDVDAVLHRECVSAASVDIVTGEYHTIFCLK